MTMKEFFEIKEIEKETLALKMEECRANFRDCYYLKTKKGELFYMDYIVTIYSDRMYNLEPDICDTIDKTLYIFNRARLSSYNMAFLKETDPLTYALKDNILF